MAVVLCSDPDPAPYRCANVVKAIGGRRHPICVRSNVTSHDALSWHPQRLVALLSVPLGGLVRPLQPIEGL